MVSPTDQPSVTFHYRRHSDRQRAVRHLISVAKSTDGWPLVILVLDDVSNGPLVFYDLSAADSPFPL